MNLTILRQMHALRRAGRDAFGRRRRVRLNPAQRRGLRLAGIGAALLLTGLVEVHSSLLQSVWFSWRAQRMTYAMAAGPSGQAQFPHSGPYDARLGYKQLPTFIPALTARGFAIERQARISRPLERFIAFGGYAIYREKSRAGLTLLGRNGVTLFARQYPERAFVDFESIPPLVVQTLLYVEDRHVLDEAARRNPAIEWQRFVLALGGQVAGLIDPDLRQGGASTLATQIEKFRHFPGGLTRGFSDKFKQMVAASLRAYQEGGDTREARRRIVATYLDSTPLASRPGHGEVIGIGDGLWAWYGTKLEEARQALTRPAVNSAELDRRALVYKQVLSLLLAQRRPAHYLIAEPSALFQRVDQFLRLLQREGVITAELAEAALRQQLRFLPQAPPPRLEPQPGRKAADALRTQLLGTLGVPSLAALDRLDLTVESTIDADAQRRVSHVLKRLVDRDYARSLGLVGKDLLGERGLERVAYSLMLYERNGDRNVLRVRADSLDDPFDVNSGAKLILGSTAKLRTLITYLNVVAELHGRLAALPGSRLREEASRARDPISRWAATTLATSRDRSLSALLEAAMQRRYPAHPGETFFTGAGLHRFHNYKRTEDRERPTVEDAFRRSVNLSFVRLMRDIVDYHVARRGIDARALLADPRHPRREVYLKRFADREGRLYLGRFHAEYRGLGSQAALQRLSRRAATRLVPQAVLYRSVRPQAGPEAFGAFLREVLGARAPGAAQLRTLYAQYDPARLSLSDRGFLAGLHPLELWLVGYLQAHPQATRTEVLRASARQRQDVYRWLFRTASPSRQSQRIRILLEEDAFVDILGDWRRQGFPFGRLVPSLATAIGSSGDRPDALATLMGIILNDGLRFAATDIDALRFAEGTPYETHLDWQAPPPQRILRPEVAATLRRALEGVVERGTAQRLRGAYRDAQCTPLHVGGKTGTSDERFKSFGAGLRLIRERPVNRTATFVFFLGDRFFGTITAYVPGAASAQYHFTSSFAVQLLRAIAPELRGLLGTAAAETAACAASRPEPARRTASSGPRHRAGAASGARALELPRG